MKTRLIVPIAVSLIVGIARANAQCGKMMGSDGHNHGGANTHGEHNTQAKTTESKAYAFINDDGIQEATIIVKDGYHPSTLVVKKGIPLRLNFNLEEESCTGTVVFKDFDITRELTLSELTALDLTPDRSGSFTFSCPMDMIRGTLIVKE